MLGTPSRQMMEFMHMFRLVKEIMHVVAFSSLNILFMHKLVLGVAI
jgi:hypothetical protein